MEPPPQLQRSVSVGPLAAALTLGAAVRVLLWQAFFLLAPVLLHDLGGSFAVIDGLTVALVVTGAVLAPFTGWLADRFGSRRLLLASFLAGALAAAAAAASPVSGVLLLAALLAGVAVALGGPAAVAAVAVFVAPGRRGAVVGIVQAGGQVGLLLAALVLTRLSAWFSWRAALLFVCLLEVVGLLVTAVSVPDVPGAVSRPGLPPFLGRLAAYALLMGGGTTFVLVALSVDEGGRYSGLVALVAAVALVGWGTLADASRLPVPDLLVRLSAGATVGAVLLLAGAVLGSAALLAGAVLVGATAVASLALVLVAVGRGAHPEIAGQTAGWVLLAASLGGVLAPFLLSPSGFDGGVVVVALMFAAATLLALAWSRSFARP